MRRAVPPVAGISHIALLAPSRVCDMAVVTYRIWLPSGEIWTSATIVAVTAVSKSTLRIVLISPPESRTEPPDDRRQFSLLSSMPGWHGWRVDWCSLEHG